MYGRSQQVEQAIFRALDGSASNYVRLNFSAIGRQTGVHQSTVTRVAQLMQKEGLIEMKRRGWYRRIGNSSNASLDTSRNISGMDQGEQIMDVLFKQQEEIIKRIDNLENKLKFLIEVIGNQKINENINSNTNSENKENQQNQENLETKTKTKTNKNTEIPFEKILDLYREILPELPQPRVLSTARKAAIRARWEEHRRSFTSQISIMEGMKENKEGSKEGSDDNTTSPCLSFFQDYFRIVAQSPFLMGEKTDWRADFDWLMKPRNFVKVLEGNYLGSPVKKMVPAITVHNEHDRAIVDAMVREYGQPVVDQAAQTLIRQGLPPMPSRVLKSLREITNETHQYDNTSDPYIEACARSFGLDDDLDPEPISRRDSTKPIIGEFWIEA